MTSDHLSPKIPQAGALTAAQMDLVIRHLPVEVSLADANDVLVYWHGPIFDDCDPAFIGRDMRACHDPAARAAIDRMVAEFRAGTRDRVRFWQIEDGRQTVAQYTAVRDDDGTYCGVLETVQDITDLRTLDVKGNDLA
jgi:DUF438 domain-containing protein